MPKQDVENANEQDQLESANARATASDMKKHAAKVEALLFTTDRPISASRIAGLIEEITTPVVKSIIELLNEKYEKAGSCFRIEAIAKGFQMLTRPEHHELVNKLARSRRSMRLTQVALETLAVVAYKQPLTRAEVESVRGVAVGDVLLRLREMKLIKVVGRAEVIGRPMLYGTTDQFLHFFGLASLKELPTTDEIPQFDTTETENEPALVDDETANTSAPI